MKKVLPGNPVFARLYNKRTTYKPELYETITGSREYRAYSKARQEQDDASTADFLRTVCGAKGKTLKEILR